MRLKEDASSWKASSIERRDARADHDFDGATGGKRKTKNKRRWCGGHEGREHVYVIALDKHASFWATMRGNTCWEADENNWRSKLMGETWQCSHVRRCEGCGRLKDAFRVPKEECPVWQEQNG